MKVDSEVLSNQRCLLLGLATLMSGSVLGLVVETALSGYVLKLEVYLNNSQV